MTVTDAAIDSVAAVSDGALRLELDGSIAELTISRPERLNAINRAVLRGLRQAVEYIEAEPRIRVAVIGGQGRAFSAGGDLTEVSALVTNSVAFDDFLDEWHATLAAVENLRVPVIAAVHGFALAGGFELVQVCDLVVMGDRSRLGDQHANYGLFPAGGSTQRLPRQMGRRGAAWLLLSGEALEATDAAAAGLVNRVVPEEQVRSAALEMAAVLAERSPSGTAAIKKALRLGAGLDVPAAIRAERPLALAHMASADAQRGFAAFRDRTTPDFSHDRRGTA
jgi:enoyl-CoA hydratase/carnithine racemase